MCCAKPFWTVQNPTLILVLRQEAHEFLLSLQYKHPSSAHKNYLKCVIPSRSPKSESCLDPLTLRSSRAQNGGRESGAEAWRRTVGMVWPGGGRHKPSELAMRDFAVTSTLFAFLSLARRAWDATNIRQLFRLARYFV